MLKYVKEQITELLNTLTELKGMLGIAIEQGDDAGLTNLLADAQDAAVVIGSRIEEAEGSAVERTAETEDQAGKRSVEAGLPDGAESRAAGLVARLEQYCELLWELTQVREKETRLALLEEAWRLLEAVRQGVKMLPRQYAAVFMPYKASMWDCMESIWQAACDDPDWIPFVVPIPYHDLKDGQITGSHYEGDRFPPYVPVMGYSVFPLEQMHPDAIFIHNPFDNCNTVTTLLPEHYSAELKKVTDRLIYSPYYVTGEAVYVTHRYLPSYENMDFIVTQCEKMIDSYSSEIPREKFLPFGSPVADRILRLEREKPAIPEEWKPQLKNGRDFGGDRAVMLNTSISLLMRQKERFLDKIEYLIDLAKHTEGITLVWRPHPLLYTAAQSLGEKYAARLDALEKKFLTEKIGVLDKTLDVGETVALCDAYLGETASSMIHMFGIAGKPRFYVNLIIPDKPEEAEDTFLVSASCQTEEKRYYVLDKPGWIVEQEKATGCIKPFVRIPGREVVRGRAYRSMELREGSLWVYPENVAGIFIVDLESRRMRKVFEPKDSEYGGRTDCGVRGMDGGKAGNLQEEEIFLSVGDECLAVMRAERFQRGNLSHEWYESENSSVEDFFSFLRTARGDELQGYQGAYAVWLASLDGSCGRKILQAVKKSLS